MFLQGLNPNMCNFSAVPFRVDDANCAKNQMYGELSKEAKAGADMNGDGIMDSTTAHVAEKDFAFINNVFPSRNTVNGNLTFVS